MSVGAIRHDLCCESTPSLHWCDGFSSELKKDAVTHLIKEACEKEWEQAWDDKFDQSGRAMFDFTWKYNPAGNRPSEGTHGWWIGLAPAGVIVSREENQPDPTEKAICQSRDVEPVKTQITIKGIHTETTIWVCSANKPDKKIDKSPLVNPQEKIDTVGNKITPAANSKAKEATRAGCNKGSSVLSPSIGGAQGALKKFGAGTDGCAQ